MIEIAELLLALGLWRNNDSSISTILPGPPSTILVSIKVDFPEPLVYINCCVFADFRLLRCVGNWVLSLPEIENNHPLLECQAGLSKEAK